MDATREAHAGCHKAAVQFGDVYCLGSRLCGYCSHVTSTTWLVQLDRPFLYHLD